MTDTPSVMRGRCHQYVNGQTSVSHAPISSSANHTNQQNGERGDGGGGGWGGGERERENRYEQYSPTAVQ